MPSISKIQDPAIKDEIVVGFLGGLNDFQDETLIKDSEPTDAKTHCLMLMVYLQDQAQIVMELPLVIVYLDYLATTRQTAREFLRFASGLNDKLQKLVSSTWTDIGTQTYDSAARMNLVQTRDLVFTFNGVDPLSYYDGSTITVYSAQLLR